MPMTADDFIRDLRTAVPEASPVVDEHLENNEGELLIHLLLADLLRFCVSAFHDGNMDLSTPCLHVVAEALTTGDEHLRNAVEVSFVEHAWDEPREFLALWPESLRTEWRDQHAT